MPVAALRAAFWGRVAAIAIAALSFARPASADIEIVQRVSDYLNGVTTLAGDFVQVAPDGFISEGSFTISRPGRLVFRFEPPNPTRLVADGFWVAVVDDSEKQAPDRYPLSETPLNLILDDDVDLVGEDAIQLVEHRDGKYRLTAIDPSGDAQGSITMVFETQPLKLKQWVIIDEQGLETSVVLRNVREGVEVDIRDFKIPSDPPFDNDRD